MRKIFSFMVVFFILFSTSSIADESLYHKASSDGVCCKMCRKGKACGNSCISRYDVCHKPPGCACDAS